MTDKLEDVEASNQVLRERLGDVEATLRSLEKEHPALKIRRLATMKMKELPAQHQTYLTESVKLDKLLLLDITAANGLKEPLVWVVLFLNQKFTPEEFENWDQGHATAGRIFAISQQWKQKYYVAEEMEERLFKVMVQEIFRKMQHILFLMTMSKLTINSEAEDLEEFACSHHAQLSEAKTLAENLVSPSLDEKAGKGFSNQLNNSVALLATAGSTGEYSALNTLLRNRDFQENLRNSSGPSARELQDTYKWYLQKSGYTVVKSKGYKREKREATASDSGSEMPHKKRRLGKGKQFPKRH